MKEEDFLTRWSRRKRAAEEESAGAQTEPPAAKSAVKSADDSAAAPPAPAEAAPEEKVDLASLPPIDSIDSASDVSVFLRKGVPTDLTRAALRRAWTADPAIRDFVGLAENAWDFNDPTAMPGFGPLDQSPEEVRQLVSQLFSKAESVIEPSPEPPTEPARASEPASDSGALASPPSSDNLSVPQQEPGNVPAADADSRDECGATISASQQEREQAHRPRRSHGGALPQ